jgi:outer membrane protein assembly factor BamB
LNSSWRYLVAFLLLWPPVSSADDGIGTWPQFRGVDGQGHVETLQLPVEFDARTNVKWRTEIPGLGHASPVHEGSTVWLATASRDGKSQGAVSVDLSSGKILQEVTVFQPASVEEIHSDNSYASPTPVLSDGRLYLHFGTYGTACLEAGSGEVLWRNNEFTIEHQGGPGSSPVLFENLLIVTCDGANEQFLAALDIADGHVVWKRPRTAPLRDSNVTHRAFTTPLLVHFKGSPQLISPGPDQCHAYHPGTGEEIWHVRYVGFSTVPRPVADDDATYFCTGYYDPELWAVELAGTGDVTSSHVRWKGKTTIPDTPSPVLHKEQVIVLTDNGVLTSLDTQTGKRNWVFRVGGNHSASPLIAGDLLYTSSEEGLVKVVDISAKPKLVATNKLGERIMASPAVIGHDLLIRTEKAIYRFGGRGEPQINTDGHR